MFRKIIDWIMRLFGVSKKLKLLEEDTNNKNHTFFAMSPYGVVMRVDDSEIMWRKNKKVVKKRKGYSYTMALNHRNAQKKFKKLGLKPVKFVQPEILAEGENVFQDINGGVTAFKVLERSNARQKDIRVEVISDESLLGLEPGHETIRAKKDVFKVVLA